MSCHGRDRFLISSGVKARQPMRSSSIAPLKYGVVAARAAEVGLGQVREVGRVHVRARLGLDRRAVDEQHDRVARVHGHRDVMPGRVRRDRRSGGHEIDRARRRLHAEVHAGAVVRRQVDVVGRGGAEVEHAAIGHVLVDPDPHRDRERAGAAGERVAGDHDVRGVVVRVAAGKPDRAAEPPGRPRCAVRERGREVVIRRVLRGGAGAVVEPPVRVVGLGPREILRSRWRSIRGCRCGTRRSSRRTRSRYRTATCRATTGARSAPSRCGAIAGPLSSVATGKPSM